MKIVKCACGCGQEIEMQAWHKYRKTSRYVRGHNMRNKNTINLQLRHIETANKKWNSFKNKHTNKHLCQCGCGNFIEITKYHVSKGIPRFIHGHHSATLNTGRKHSIKTRIKFSLGHTKEKKFTGFKSLLASRIRNSSNYKNWRMMVFDRDDFTCQDCDKKSCYLEAHHIIPFSEILVDKKITTLSKAINCEQLWNIDNGIAYCSNCHRKNDKSRR